jgi:hypothetical protein
MSEMNLPKRVRIDRHKFDASKHQALLPEDCRELSGLLREAPSDGAKLAWVGDLSEMVLERASVFDRTSPMIPVAVRTLAQVNTGLMLLRMADPESRTQIAYGDGKAVLPSVGDSMAHIGIWTEGWYAALMARDEECLQLLGTVPDPVLRASPTESDECAYVWKAALIAFRANPESALPLVEQAIRLNRPEHAKIAHPKAAAIRGATYAILAALVRGDAAAVNEALTASLTAHKQFWGSRAEAQARRGWIARGALALACLAHDQSIPVSIESEYLLPGLIERTLAMPR